MLKMKIMLPQQVHQATGLAGRGLTCKTFKGVMDVIRVHMTKEGKRGTREEQGNGEREESRCKCIREEREERKNERD